jgi:hypothetical protein
MLMRRLSPQSPPVKVGGDARSARSLFIWRNAEGQSRFGQNRHAGAGPTP